MTKTDSRPKVLIPEPLSSDGLALLSPTLDIHTHKGLSPDDLQALIPAYSALIIRSETKVTKALLEHASNLKIIARAGVGVDNIDIGAATERGVIVVNSPSGNIVAAAEHTVALLMATARNIAAGNASLKGGKWERGGLVGNEVRDKVLGIVGLGKVGLKVARMAVGLGMRVLGVDPFAGVEVARGAGVELIESLEGMLGKVDWLSVHTPLIDSTLGMIGERELKQMKGTARVLNVARGGVVNEEALLKALDEGWIAGAGLDVFTSEPPKTGSVAEKLIQHPKVVATPHLGASTVEAQENVSIDVCSQVVKVLAGELPTSAVNAPLILPEEYRKLQPFVKLVEKMGSLYTQHFTASARKHGGGIGGKVFDLVYEGELATVSNTRPLFAAVVKGLLGVISDSGGRDINIVNATLIAKEKGIVINESHNRESSNLTYASLVTLRAAEDQVISGYCSGNAVNISRLGRFSTSFVPEGTLLVLRNFDKPGKIGKVGSVLGKRDVNIKFMEVGGLNVDETGKRGNVEHEALMILGVDGIVDGDVVRELAAEEGILDVSVVRL
jgi:D-3-phosphoglycerate dehydrogenase